MSGNPAPMPRSVVSRRSASRHTFMSPIEIPIPQGLLMDDTQVYKQFVENESFKRFVGDMVYAMTSQ
jgi:hypothetical protein